MVNSARIAKRLDTKSTEKISIAFGDLEGLSELFSSTMGSDTSLEQVKEKVGHGEIEISGRKSLVNL